MTRYKLMNKVKKELRELNKGEIQKVKFSWGLIKKLFNDNICTEITIYRYCCYGEDRSCWTDATAGWLFDNGMTEEHLNVALYKYLKRLLNEVRRYKKKDFNIYVQRCKSGMCLAIPARDIHIGDIFVNFKYRT